MARKSKPQSIFDLHMEADRHRQELYAHRLLQVNKNAGRSILENANVLQTGPPQYAQGRRAAGPDRRRIELVPLGAPRAPAHARRGRRRRHP
jgi:hypothetical protein